VQKVILFPRRGIAARKASINMLTTMFTTFIAIVYTIYQLRAFWDKWWLELLPSFFHRSPKDHYFWSMWPRSIWLRGWLRAATSSVRWVEKPIVRIVNRFLLLEFLLQLRSVLLATSLTHVARCIHTPIFRQHIIPTMIMVAGLILH
jgi:hypothetical protein